MDTIHISQTQAILWFMVLNAGIGFVLGLIPLLFGYFSKQLKLGLIAIAVTTVGGAIVGIIVSIPATIIFTWLVARNARRAKNVGFPPAEE
ncbi:MAG: hypothetical protein KF756_01510 [Acidobacteria bacterium]|nr:hypothetical protein [Acidobacteriota bacterium]